MKPYFSILLALLLLTSATTQPAFAQFAPAEKFRARVVEWGPNKRVAVKLKSGDQVQGRIAEIKDATFLIQLLEKGQVTSREINYSDIKKLSAKGDHEGAKVVGYIVIGALAALGTIVLIGLALAD